MILAGKDRHCCSDWMPTKVWYQGESYLVTPRHIKPFRGIYHVAVQPEIDKMLYRLLRYWGGPYLRV